MVEMGYPYSKMELGSVMSASKGFLGECGTRGGSIELFNMCPNVKYILMRFMSGMLCPNVLGQVAIDCVVRLNKRIRSNSS
jgi:alanine transaminase